MLKKSFLSAVAATLISISLAENSQAAVALTFTTQGFQFPNGSFNYGWTFSLAQSENVGGLGVWDFGGNGLTDSHPVGIWNSGGSLVATTTVPSGTSADFVASGSGGSGFRFADLSSSVALAAGSYTVAAYFPTGSDQVAGGVTAGNLTSMSGLTYGQSRQGAAGGLALPGTRVVGDEIAFFGGNFRTVVPEPTSLGLLGAGAAILLRRRKHSSSPTINFKRTPQMKPSQYNIASLLVSLALVGTAAHSVHADPNYIYSNLTNNFDVYNGNGWHASAFVTDGVTSGTDLLTVDIEIGTYNAGTPTNDFFVQLWSSSGGQPGSLVTALSGDTDPNGGALNSINSYPYTANATLAANTTYWVVFGNASDAIGYWVSYNRNTSPTLGADTGVTYRSTDQGANWALSPGGSNGTGAIDNTNMRVSFGVVPEPACLAFGGAGALLMLRRRRRVC
ncbi:MAG: PEP-CTERM sorting domain-containing protein [Burkholderiales bacterium]|nr:PEP-CTERM sorting domain-containing protein [Phycisphaerae bacterium]